MARTTMDELFEQVKALPPDEQRRLRALLDAWLPSSALEPTEEELNRRLLEAGLLSQIPPPITDFTPFRERVLIEIKGKPLSETILEERR